MDTEDNDLLDVDSSEYVCSDGGDSLLDSDCEQEQLPSKSLSVLSVNTSTTSSPSRNLSPQNTTTPSSRSERSRIIRLDGPRKFRCVDESLPNDINHVSKRPKPHKPLVITRQHKKITKPSLLLDTKRLLVSDTRQQFDLRNTIIANRTNDLRDRIKTTSDKRAASTTSEPIHSRPHLLTLSSNANQRNLFYARISAPTSKDVNNPFFTALKEVNEQQTFSFSLSHITK